MKQILKWGVLFFIYATIAAILLSLTISALGIYGLGLAGVGVILAYASPGFRRWLHAQPGFNQRLAKLPGLGSSSPKTLSFFVALYLIPLSIFCRLFLSVDNFQAASTQAMVGLVGLFLGYGWFIRGWRVKNPQAAVEAPQFSFNDKVTFLKENKVTAALLAVALSLPLIGITGGLYGDKNTSMVEIDEPDGRVQTVASLEEDDSNNSAQVANPTATNSKNENITSVDATQEITTADPAEATATSANQPTNTSTPIPTRRATATPTLLPQVNVSVSSANLRSGPGTNYSPVGVVNGDDLLILLARTADDAWFIVQLADGSIGWLAASVIEDSDLAVLKQVEVAATIPSPPTATAAPVTLIPTATLLPTLTSTPVPQATVPPIPPTAPPQPSNCDPAYPTVCIPPPPPDLDCGDIPYRRFTVLSPDPHGFDRDNDGIGCES